MNGQKKLNPLVSKIMLPVDPQPLIPDTNTPNMHHYNGRVIRPSVKLTLIGESSLTIPESHEDDPTGYYESVMPQTRGSH